MFQSPAARAVSASASDERQALYAWEPALRAGHVRARPVSAEAVRAGTPEAGVQVAHVVARPVDTPQGLFFEVSGTDAQYVQESLESLSTDRGTLFDGFGAIWSTTVQLSGDGDPEQLRGGLGTTNFFPVLGAQAAIGRTFTEEDDAAQGPPGILLSWSVFQQRYGGDQSVVGKRILVNGAPTTVIGVMPPDFRLWLPTDSSVPDKLQAWTPLLTGAQRPEFVWPIVGQPWNVLREAAVYGWTHELGLGEPTALAPLTDWNRIRVGEQR